MMLLLALIPLLIATVSCQRSYSSQLLLPQPDYEVLEHYLQFIAIGGCIRSADKTEALATTTETLVSTNGTVVQVPKHDYISLSQTSSSCKSCTQFPDLEVVHVWVDKNHSDIGTLWGYIGVDHRSERIVIVNRGFMRYGEYDALEHDPVDLIIPELALELEDGETDFPVCNDDGCKVDKLVYDAYLSVWNQTREPLCETIESYPEYSLFVGGHNVGGGVAQLMAVTLKLLQFDPLLVTVGQPAIGTAPFAQWHDKLFHTGGPLVRFERTTRGDYMPSLREVVQITSLDHQYHSIEHFGGEQWPADTHQFITTHHKYCHTKGRIGLTNGAQYGQLSAYYLDSIYGPDVMKAMSVDIEGDGNDEDEDEPQLEVTTTTIHARYVPPNMTATQTLPEQLKRVPLPSEVSKKDPAPSPAPAPARKLTDNAAKSNAQQPLQKTDGSFWYGVPMWCENNDLEEYEIDHDYCAKTNSTLCNASKTDGPWNMIPN